MNNTYRGILLGLALLGATVLTGFNSPASARDKDNQGLFQKYRDKDDQKDARQDDNSKDRRNNNDNARPKPDNKWRDDRPGPGVNVGGHNAGDQSNNNRYGTHNPWDHNGDDHPWDHNPGNHNPGDNNGNHNPGNNNPGNHNPGNNNSGNHNPWDHNGNDNHNPWDNNRDDHKWDNNRNDRWDRNDPWDRDHRDDRWDYGGRPSLPPRPANNWPTYGGGYGYGGYNNGGGYGYGNGGYNNGGYGYGGYLPGQGGSDYRTIEGIVSKDTRGNDFIICMSDGREVKVYAQRGEPGWISRGERVRLYGCYHGSTFFTDNLVILNNRY